MCLLSPKDIGVVRKMFWVPPSCEFRGSSFLCVVENSLVYCLLQACPFSFLNLARVVMTNVLTFVSLAKSSQSLIPSFISGIVFYVSIIYFFFFLYLLTFWLRFSFFFSLLEEYYCMLENCCVSSFETLSDISVSVWLSHDDVFSLKLWWSRVSQDERVSDLLHGHIMYLESLDPLSVVVMLCRRSV